MKIVRIDGVGEQSITSDQALDWQKMLTKAVWHLMVQLTCEDAEGSSSLHIFNWPNSRLPKQCQWWNMAKLSYASMCEHKEDWGVSQQFLASTFWQLGLSVSLPSWCPSCSAAFLSLMCSQTEGVRKNRSFEGSKLASWTRRPCRSGSLDEKELPEED